MPTYNTGYIDVSIPAYTTRYKDAAVPAYNTGHIDHSFRAYNTFYTDASNPDYDTGYIDRSIPTFWPGQGFWAVQRWADLGCASGLCWAGWADQGLGCLPSTWAELFLS
jgi:hypothetical protein